MSMTTSTTVATGATALSSCVVSTMVGCAGTESTSPGTGVADAATMVVGSVVTGVVDAATMVEGSVVTDVAGAATTVVGPVV